MPDMEKIHNMISLLEDKKLYEWNLLAINYNIKLNQSKCSHVGVYMGNYADGDNCKCVVCKSDLNIDQMMDLASNGLVIYAQNYLTSKNSGCLENFDLIQTMYLGLCRQNELASNEEIVSLFQEMINKSLNSREEEENTTLTNMDEDIFKGSKTESKGIAKVLEKDD